ncbi:CemA-like proton extrusion protein-related protein, partial [Prunus dulcis]
VQILNRGTHSMITLNSFPSIFVPLVGLVFPAIAMASLSLYYESAIRTYMDRTYSRVSKNKFIRFLLVGTSSYLQIIFFPQGIVMSFYGIAGLFISSYLWCTISWNVGSGYDRFDIKRGVVCIFRWGFPGKNRRIFLRFLMKDIQSIRIEIKEGIYARRVLYMEIKGQGAIPLTRTDENLTPREIEQKLLNWPISCVYQLNFFRTLIRAKANYRIESTNEVRSVKIKKFTDEKMAKKKVLISLLYLASIVFCLGGSLSHLIKVWNLGKEYSKKIHRLRGTPTFGRNVKGIPEALLQKPRIEIYKETIQLIKMHNEDRTHTILHFSTNIICSLSKWLFYYRIPFAPRLGTNDWLCLQKILICS